MSLGDICNYCKQGELRMFQLSLKEAVITCSNTDCDGFLDSPPVENTVHTNIHASSSTLTASRSESRSSLCSSLDAPASPAPSYFSATDQEVAFISKASSHKLNRTSIQKHKQTTRDVAKPVTFSSNIVPSETLPQPSASKIQSNVSEWEKFIPSSNVTEATDEDLDRFLDSLTEEAPVKPISSRIIPSDSSAFLQLGDIPSSTSNNSCSVTSKEKIGLVTCEAGDGKESGKNLSLKDSLLEKLFLSPAGSVVSEDSGYNEEMPSAIGGTAVVSLPGTGSGVAATKTTSSMPPAAAEHQQKAVVEATTTPSSVFTTVTSNVTKCSIPDSVQLSINSVPYTVEELQTSFTKNNCIPQINYDYSKLNQQSSNEIASSSSHVDHNNKMTDDLHNLNQSLSKQRLHFKPKLQYTELMLIYDQNIDNMCESQTPPIPSISKPPIAKVLPNIIKTCEPDVLRSLDSGKAVQNEPKHTVSNETSLPVNACSSVKPSNITNLKTKVRQSVSPGRPCKRKYNKAKNEEVSKLLLENSSQSSPNPIESAEKKKKTCLDPKVGVTESLTKKQLSLRKLRNQVQPVETTRPVADHSKVVPAGVRPSLAALLPPIIQNKASGQGSRNAKRRKVTHPFRQLAGDANVDPWAFPGILLDELHIEVVLHGKPLNPPSSNSSTTKLEGNNAKNELKIKIAIEPDSGDEERPQSSEGLESDSNSLTKNLIIDVVPESTSTSAPLHHLKHSATNQTIPANNSSARVFPRVYPRVGSSQPVVAVAPIQHNPKLLSSKHSIINKLSTDFTKESKQSKIEESSHSSLLHISQLKESSINNKQLAYSVCSEESFEAKQSLQCNPSSLGSSAQLNRKLSDSINSGSRNKFQHIRTYSSKSPSIKRFKKNSSILLPKRSISNNQGIVPHSTLISTVMPPHSVRMIPNHVLSVPVSSNNVPPTVIKVEQNSSPLVLQLPRHGVGQPVEVQYVHHPQTVFEASPQFSSQQSSRSQSVPIQFLPAVNSNDIYNSNISYVPSHQVVDVPSVNKNNFIHCEQKQIGVVPRHAVMAGGGGPEMQQPAVFCLPGPHNQSPVTLLSSTTVISCSNKCSTGNSSRPVSRTGNNAAENRVIGDRVGQGNVRDRFSVHQCDQSNLSCNICPVGNAFECSTETLPSEQKVYGTLLSQFELQDDCDDDHHYAPNENLNHINSALACDEQRVYLRTDEMDCPQRMIRTVQNFAVGQSAYEVHNSNSFILKTVSLPQIIYTEPCNSLGIVTGKLSSSLCEKNKISIGCCSLKESSPEHTQIRSEKNCSKNSLPEHTQIRSEEDCSKKSSPKHTQIRSEEDCSKNSSTKHRQIRSEEDSSKNSSPKHTQIRSEEDCSKNSSPKHRQIRYEGDCSKKASPKHTQIRSEEDYSNVSTPKHTQIRAEEDCSNVSSPKHMQIRSEEDCFTESSLKYVQIISEQDCSMESSPKLTKIRSEENCSKESSPEHKQIRSEEDCEPEFELRLVLSDEDEYSPNKAYLAALNKCTTSGGLLREESTAGTLHNQSGNSFSTKDLKTATNNTSRVQVLGDMNLQNTITSNADMVNIKVRVDVVPLQQDGQLPAKNFIQSDEDQGLSFFTNGQTKQQDLSPVKDTLCSTVNSVMSPIMSVESSSKFYHNALLDRDALLSNYSFVTSKCVKNGVDKTHLKNTVIRTLNFKDNCLESSNNTQTSIDISLSSTDKNNSTICFKSLLSSKDIDYNNSKLDKSFDHSNYKSYSKTKLNKTFKRSEYSKTFKGTVSMVDNKLNKEKPNSTKYNYNSKDEYNLNKAISLRPDISRSSGANCVGDIRTDSSYQNGRLNRQALPVKSQVTYTRATVSLPNKDVGSTSECTDPNALSPLTSKDISNSMPQYKMTIEDQLDPTDSSTSAVLDIHQTYLRDPLTLHTIDLDLQSTDKIMSMMKKTYCKSGYQVSNAVNNKRSFHTLTNVIDNVKTTQSDSSNRLVKNLFNQNITGTKRKPYSSLKTDKRAINSKNTSSKQHLSKFKDLFTDFEKYGNMNKESATVSVFVKDSDKVISNYKVDCPFGESPMQKVKNVHYLNIRKRQLDFRKNDSETTTKTSDNCNKISMTTSDAPIKITSSTKSSNDVYNLHRTLSKQLSNNKLLAPTAAPTSNSITELPSDMDAYNELVACGYQVKKPSLEQPVGVKVSGGTIRRYGIRDKLLQKSKFILRKMKAREECKKKKKKRRLIKKKDESSGPGKEVAQKAVDDIIASRGSDELPSVVIVSVKGKLFMYGNDQ